MHIYYSFYTQPVKYVAVLPPCDKPTRHLQKWIIKRELDSRDESAVTKQRYAGSEIQVNVNEVTEETANMEMLALPLF